MLSLATSIRVLRLSIRTGQLDWPNSVPVLRNIVVPIVNTERCESRQRLELRRNYFRNKIWGDIIPSLLNKVYINSSTIRRHSGGVIND
jgi:hypothetical protein